MNSDVSSRIVDIDRNYRKKKKRKRLKRQQILFPRKVKGNKKAYKRISRSISLLLIPLTSPRITKNNSKFHLEPAFTLRQCRCERKNKGGEERKEKERFIERTPVAGRPIFTTAFGDRSFTLISGWIYR